MSDLTFHEEVDEVTGLSRKIVVDSPDEKRQPMIEIRDKHGKVMRKYHMPSHAHLKMMRWVLAAVAVFGCSAPALTALPENPCDLLSIQQVATVAGVEISGAHRVLSQGESIEAGESGRQPPPGSICRYERPRRWSQLP